MWFFFLTLIGLGIFSYGFTDPNLVLSTNPLFVRFHEPLFDLVYHNRPVTAAIFFSILVSLFVFYGFMLRAINISVKKLFIVLFGISVVLALSYPAFTYDLFNYMTTAKVTFTHHENPYFVMPIEIPNEPYLAFTRAANKYALYGPVWILLTALPHYLGGGNVWVTFILFKSMNGIAYILFAYLVFRITGSMKNVVFFAYNPLILIETLVSGHNDLYMMILALSGLYLWQQKSKLAGFLLFFSSWWIKGATIVLFPLLFMKKLSWERLLVISYWLLVIVFIIVAPLREELYPWYATWLIATASLMNLKTNRTLIGFTIVLSFALELRHLPYMWMGYYEGYGPMARMLLTVIPVAIYAIWRKIRYT
jgi:hypothetical protein